VTLRLYTVVLERQEKSSGTCLWRHIGTVTTSPLLLPKGKYPISLDGDEVYYPQTVPSCNKNLSAGRSSIRLLLEDHSGKLNAATKHLVGAICPNYGEYQ